jgi:hypothetical protein|tara:strand:- start:192 stop:491 length:300 start_codon:yes stop_codon:yes gene_type:complete
MTDIQPSNDYIIENIDNIIEDISKNYEEYGLEEKKINIHDLALLLKKSFILYEITITINSKRRSVLTYLKKKHKGLLSYVKKTTEFKIDRSNTDIWILL